ncbi:MAG: 1,4-alpha-glucan branching protein GlgB [Oscillospiraceae bacterium]|nr:1,4-alpha-glucan branching protein GlgB [Oscillospiraceae bacterium]
MSTTNNPAVFYFHQGTNYESYRYFGSHPDHRDGQDGVVFRVWAPHAQSVSVCGSFNEWDTKDLPMTKISDSGIWERFVPGVLQYDSYKYYIVSAEGKGLYKADPFAVHAETPPGTASKFYDLSGYEWGDSQWQEMPFSPSFDRPMNIYEVHLGSWRMHEDGNVYSYREMADQLADYVSEMGYTHVELMPVSEYPFDGSWGYQVTGYFAPTSRYGTPHDFMYFVDRMHQKNIGVILDWVPAHFPKDASGLYEFDGGYCYEDSNPLRMEHKEWGTRVFDFGKTEVQSFLVSSAVNWLDTYHVDGLRVDAVASMLYLDYDRKDGEWAPNSRGGRENLEAIAFLQKLNEQIFARFPNAVMAAEESTAWPMVTKPTSVGGLGFNYKWNMGWMNDSLSYCQTDPFFRKGVHNKLTFSMMYAYSENYILPISHDEVVHGKCSMIEKMPGGYEQKFANLRAFYAYMFAHPGKKLTFMGSEFAQFIEWRYYEGLDWQLLQYDMHRRFQSYMKDLFHLYRDMPQFWEQDSTWDGFKWIDADDSDRNCLSFIRYAKDGSAVVVLCNFAPVERKYYRIGVPYSGSYRIILNSDSTQYGGGTKPNILSYRSDETPYHGFENSVCVDLPPMSALYLEAPRNKITRRNQE